MKLIAKNNYLFYYRKEERIWKSKELCPKDVIAEKVIYNSIEELRGAMSNVGKYNYCEGFLLKETQKSFIIFQFLSFEKQSPKMSRVVLGKE